MLIHATGAALMTTAPETGLSLVFYTTFASVTDVRSVADAVGRASRIVTIVYILICMHSHRNLLHFGECPGCDYDDVNNRQLFRQPLAKGVPSQRQHDDDLLAIIITLPHLIQRHLYNEHVDWALLNYLQNVRMQYVYKLICTTYQNRVCHAV